MDSLREVRRFVRRARVRLEIVRLGKAAARGALWAGSAGVLLTLFSKAWPGWTLAPIVPWSICFAGAVIAALAARVRGGVSLEAAALFLDRRLGTHEALSTLVTRPQSSFAPYIAHCFASLPRQPALSVPREATLLPAALFLLFAVGLIPGARGDLVPAARLAGALEVEVAGASALAPAKPIPDVSAAVARLAKGESPLARDAGDLREAIERGVRRPEDRRSALLALLEAEGGDGAASKEVAGALKGLVGARGGEENATPESKDGARGPGEASSGRTLGVVYPEQQEFLRAFRRALSKKGKR
ncbi:MAG: hypothetical protein O7E54_11565 [Planctomycetota bacterium]|nr:hypothetical protein [Planctomycetota bacterium]